ncbi:hypothetical protein KIF59_18895 [Enterobacter cloacae subsp. cloacae]|nr:hypothetical protein [Enterobacter cloacae subsp. cloacae]
MRQRAEILAGTRGLWRSPLTSSPTRPAPTIRCTVIAKRPLDVGSLPAKAETDPEGTVLAAAARWQNTPPPCWRSARWHS